MLFSLSTKIINNSQKYLNDTQNVGSFLPKFDFSKDASSLSRISLFGINQFGLVFISRRGRFADLVNHRRPLLFHFCHLKFSSICCLKFESAIPLFQFGKNDKLKYKQDY